MVWSLGLRDQVQGLESGVQGVGFRGLGLSVQGSGFKTRGFRAFMTWQLGNGAFVIGKAV